MADFPNFPKYAGNSPIVDSGSVIIERTKLLTIEIHGLSFYIKAIHDPKIERISTEPRGRNKLLVNINTWQGGDPTFKFKVGTLLGTDLHLAVHLAEHSNYYIWTYTFTQERP
jgi:hypothetical protein